MLTRKQIEEEYNVVDGIIQDKGRFENEPVWTPYFYDALLEEGGNTTTLLLESVDHEEFPEIPNKDYAWVKIDDNGFISVEFINEPHSFYDWDEL